MICIKEGVAVSEDIGIKGEAPRITATVILRKSPNT